MKVIVSFAVLAFLSVFLVSAKPPASRYDGYKVYRISVQDEEQLKEFKKLGDNFPVFYLSEFHGVGHTYNIAIGPEFQERLEKLLKNRKIISEVAIESTQELNENASRLGKSYSKMDWTKYHTLEEIYDWLDLQVTLHSKYLIPYTLGFSYEGRPIKGVKLSKREGNKVIFIESNIHAMEWISSATSTYVLNELLNSEDPEIKSLSEVYDWVFVPMVNPDGYTYTHDVFRIWRKNRRPTGATKLCVGVDMNRNLDFHWNEAGTFIEEPCDVAYAGSEPDSEPEVKALEQFINSFDGIRIYMAMHSYGQYMLLPYGYTTEVFPPNYDQMMRLSKAFAENAVKLYGTNYTYGASALLNYPVSGAVKDWAYGVKNIPYTCTLELRDKGTYGFLLPARFIIPVGEEVTLGLKALIAKAKEEGLFD